MTTLWKHTKLALVLALGALVFATPVAAQTGLRGYYLTVVDEFGNTVTDDCNMLVLIAGSSAATVYSDVNGTAIGTTLETVTDGIFKFWYGVGTCDIQVTNNSTSNSVKYSGVSVTDHRIMISKVNAQLGATTYTGTVTGVAGTWTGTQTYGVDATGVDVQFYGDTTVNTCLWDYSDDRWELTAADIVWDDNSDAIFGTHFDFVLDSDTTGVLDLLSLLTDDTAAFNIGVNTAGIDVKFFGATTGEYFLWDASEDTITVNTGNAVFTMTDGEVNQFKVDATGTGAGFVIVFETTNGGVQINADGGDNGDVDIDAADDITVTAAGDLTLAVTGTLSVGGSQLVNTLRDVSIETGASDAVSAAQSGMTFASNFTGTQTYTLPDAAAGLWYVFIDNSATAADDVVIDCQAGDNIDGDSNGDAIESVTDAVPQVVILVAIDGTDWVTISKVGTWGQQ